MFDDGFQGRQVRECLALPGTSEEGIGDSGPPVYGVTVTGTQQIAAFRACAAEIEGAVVTEAGISRPADPAANVLTAGQQAFIEECLSGNVESALSAPGFVGRTYEEVAAPNERPVNPVRVLGRDGNCLDREDDRRENRVNVIIEDGTVIWAGRF